MKCLLLTALLVPLALVGCAADPMPPEGDESAAAGTTEEADAAEKVGTAQSELRFGLDDSKYCLPGEVVKCDLGPPPKCRCVAKTTTTPVLVAW